MYRRTTSLLRLKDAYCRDIGLDPHSEAMVCGEFITQGQTADNLELEDGTTIYIVTEKNAAKARKAVEYILGHEARVERCEKWWSVRVAKDLDEDPHVIRMLLCIKYFRIWKILHR